MDSDRWKQVDNLLLAVLDRPPAERDAFLRQASGGDEALEHEVRSLLTSDRQAGSFLEAPAMEVAARASRQSEESTVLQTGLSGQTISHYKIQEMLGAGGMGVVYKAFDTKLNRLVALKFLSPHLRHQDELKRRLTAEARAASALDHPNIVVIHEIGESPDGDLFIAMAYQEGATLRDKIDAGLPVTEALQIARQVASGLARAHEHGIFHRDIKPSNIIVAKDGTARIIDFGLAKSSDATVTMDGSTKGTPLYMSPEQASGKATDFRTDLWSLGAVLYEMLAGAPPFHGDSQLSVMRAIVQDAQPKLRDIRPDTPIDVQAIVTKALEKDPTKRYQSASEMASDLSAALLGSPNSHTSQRPRNWKNWKVRGPAVVAMLASFGAVYLSLHRTQKLTNKDTIILADFKNTTGDPVFDGTLRQGLAVQLGQSPFLSLVSDERIQKTLRLMGQSADARITPEIARDICERSASAAVLEGSIASLGSQYVIGLRAKNCRTGDILDEEQVQASKKEDVLNALSQIATKFRTRVGESLSMVEKHSTPLVEATTPSLDALKAYSVARKLYSSSGSSAAALPFLKRAIEIDPKFATAHVWMGRLYGDHEDPALSRESTTKAWQLRDHASDREKFYITAAYEMQVTGNLEKLRQTCELWRQTYPREKGECPMLGITYVVAGKFEKAVEESKTIIELDPDGCNGYLFLASGYVQLDRLVEAETTLRRASERKLEIPDFLVQRHDIAFLKGDTAGMEREITLSRGEPEAEPWVSNHAAFGLAYSGHLRQARKMSRRAVDLTQQSGWRERAALYETGAALSEAFSGNAPEAKRNVTAALALSKELYVEYGAAFALALSGDSAGSQTLADDIEKRFPEDTGVRFSYMPSLRALLALNHRQPAKAIELLQNAVAYELGWPRSSIHGFFGALYPIYVRGLAYLAAHQGAEAAVEFQKILDHRGIVVSDAIGALAHLQLGRALVISGDRTKAKAAYQDFLTLWKDADSDLPILKQAKAEYASIH